MKETGIIMSGDHPRKILDGTKTMTRRTSGLEKINKEPDAWCIAGHIDVKWGFGNLHCEDDVVIKCPYGQVGDRLWVGETWCQDLDWNGITKSVAYKASAHPNAGFKWKPSIFMPRWASRITLEIIEVRVERVQEITAVDVVREGIPVSMEEYPWSQFRNLWDSINGKKYPWESNPWVWVIGW